MGSWWQLGEGSGQRGADLAVYEVTCAFCLERGNFNTVFHAEKKKPNGSKVLNFDTLECGNCKGYVLVLWSATEFPGFQDAIHAYRVLPWADENWDAADGARDRGVPRLNRSHSANGEGACPENCGT